MVFSVATHVAMTHRQVARTRRDHPGIGRCLHRAGRIARRYTEEARSNHLQADWDEPPKRSGAQHAHQAEMVRTAQTRRAIASPMVFAA